MLEIIVSQFIFDSTISSRTKTSTSLPSVSFSQSQSRNQTNTGTQSALLVRRFLPESAWYLVGIETKLGCMDAYNTLRLKQLAIAHKTTLLIFSKNRELGRKLRPEFSKCFIVSDLREGIKSIKKYNADPDNPGIDVALIDCPESKTDQSAIKFLEFLNKRMTDVETRSFPLIATVLLIPESYDGKEYSEMCGTLLKNFTHKQVLIALVEAIHNKNAIEKTYKQLRSKQTAFKYPHIPIFTDISNNCSDANIDDDDDDFNSADGKMKKKKVLVSNTAAIIDPELSSFDTPDSLADWTDNSSLIPDGIKEFRKSVSNEIVSGKVDIGIRHSLDTKFLKKLESDELNLNDEEATTTSKLDDDLNESNSYVENSFVRSKKNVAVEKRSNYSDREISVGKLLDPRTRPKWGAGNTLASLIQNRESMVDGEQDFDNTSKVFFQRPVPNLSLEHTIGGLDKKIASVCWNVMNSRAVKDNDEENKTTEIIAEKVETVMSRADELPHLGSNRNVNLAENLKQSIKAFDKAEKTIKKMSKEVPIDIQIHNMMEIDFHQRNGYCGEKDLFEHGKRCEEEDSIEDAISLYTRAGLHSKEPHLSKIFLGVLYFKQRKYMQSLLCFTHAIEIQTHINESLYNWHDDFISHYNRGVVNLKVGNDDQGLADLAIALNLDPDSLPVAEVYAIALRRSKRYEESIQLFMKNKRLRMGNDAIAEKKKVVAALEKKKKEENKDEIDENSLPALNRFRASIAGKISFRSVSSQQRGGNSAQTEASPAASRSPSASPHGSPSVTIKKSLKSVVSQSIRRKSALLVKVVDQLQDVSYKGNLVSIIDTCDNSNLTRANKMLLKSSNSNEDSGNGVSALKQFKLKQGYKADLFESICIKPSQLQLSLAAAPMIRKVHQIDLIVTCLRLAPFLQGLSNSDIAKLASSVEYRAISVPGNFMQQDKVVEAVCVLIKGDVKIFMEASDVLAQNVQVGTVRNYDMFGHIDAIFRGDSQLVDNLRSQCIESENSVNDTDDNNLGERKNYNEDTDTFIEFRPLQPNLFSTYSSTGICEILLFDLKSFDDIIRPQAEKELNMRLEIIGSCGLFKSWPRQDQIRLARMGQVRTYKTGEILVEQGHIPDYIYFIIKGICKAFKRPNRVEIFTRILIDLKEKAHNHDVNFAYHHKLRKNFTSAKVNNDEQSYLSHIMKKMETTPEHITDSELTRYRLGLEINSYENLLHKAQAADLKDSLEQDSLDSLNNEKDKMTEISTLNWPMFFGEASVLDPSDGKSRGTIIADTTVELFCVHKLQLQTFLIDQRFLDDVRRKSIRYPDDKELVAKLDREKVWMKYREEVLKEIPKNRWLPGKNEEVIQFVL